MSELKVYTNHHRHPIIYYWELTKEEKDDFDWVEDGDNDHTFFRYRGNTYCLSDFMQITPQAPKEFQSWHGYISDSFFSGILIKWPLEDWGQIDTDFVITGTFIS